MPMARWDEITDEATARAAFRWEVPTRFNIATAACDRWADGSGRPALIFEDEAGQVERLDFDALKFASSRLARAFQGVGLTRGDRVGIGEHCEIGILPRTVPPPAAMAGEDGGDGRGEGRRGTP